MSKEQLLQTSVLLLFEPHLISRPHFTMPFPPIQLVGEAGNCSHNHHFSLFAFSLPCVLSHAGWRSSSEGAPVFGKPAYPSPQHSTALPPRGSHGDFTKNGIWQVSVVI